MVQCSATAKRTRLDSAIVLIECCCVSELIMQKNLTNILELCVIEIYCILTWNIDLACLRISKVTISQAQLSVQLFAATVVGDQLNSESSGQRLLIGSRQRLHQTVAQKVPQFIVNFTHDLTCSSGTKRSLTRSKWPSMGSGCTVWCFLCCEASRITFGRTLCMRGQIFNSNGEPSII